MNCPKCKEKLEPSFSQYQDERPECDYIEVELACKNEHIYFTRIKEDDLIWSDINT